MQILIVEKSIIVYERRSQPYNNNVKVEHELRNTIMIWFKESSTAWFTSLLRSIYPNYPIAEGITNHGYIIY